MNGKVMPVRIVPMKTEHLDAVAELERSCFTVPWSRNALAEELDNALSAFLVALDENDRVVGYAGLQVVLDEGYITNVAVRPDCRRRGVAGIPSLPSTTATSRYLSSWLRSSWKTRRDLQSSLSRTTVLFLTPMQSLTFR